MWRALGTVEASSGSFTNSTTLLFRLAVNEPSPGRWLTTKAWAVSKAGEVVNWLRKSAREFPEMSLTSLVATTVTTVEAGRTPALRVTVRLSEDRLICGKRETPPASKAKVVLFTEAWRRDLEKVSTTVAFWPIPVAPFTGLTLTNCGGMVSFPEVVVKVLVKSGGSACVQARSST